MIRLLTVGQTGIRTETRFIDVTAPKLVLATLYVAMGRGRRVSRDELLALFWPDTQPDKARHNLRELLHRLKGLGVQMAVNSAAIALDPADVIADYDELRNGDLAEMTDARIAGFATLLPIPNSVLKTFPPALNRWVDDVRDVIARELTRGLVGAIGAARTAGDWRRVEQLATACRGLDTLNEEANLALAEALCMTASKERALAVLDEYSAEVGRAEAIRLPVRLLRERIQVVAAGATTLLTDRLTEPPFVGRAGQRAELLAAFDSAAKQHGRACCVWGTAGIGKTRLLSEVAKDVALRGGTALSLTCHASDNLRPLSVLFDLVPRLLELPGALGADGAALAELRAMATEPLVDVTSAKLALPDDSLRLRRQAALLDILDAVADERPLVITVDDAQWMDPALASFWTAVLPWSRARAILWLFGCRADSEEAVIATAFGAYAQPMQLGALDTVASRELIRSLIRHATDGGDVIARVAERGGGHPLVLRELARHYVATCRLDERPASIAPLIDERLNHLSRAAVRVLQAGGLLDALATMDRVSRLVQLTMNRFDDAVAELAVAGIVDEDSTVVLRCHALWTEAAVARLQPVVAAAMHRQAAHLLEAEMAQAPSLQLLWECARHWQVGGDGTRALTAIERGAEHLVGQGFLHDAAEVYGRAVEQCVDVHRRLALLRRRMVMLRSTGQLSAEIAAVDEHERLASQVDVMYDPHNEIELRRLLAADYVAGNGRSAAVEALRCAQTTTASPAHRIEAAWHCARLAEPNSMYGELRAAYEISQALPAMTQECVWRKQHTAIKYHVSLGSPDVAVQLSRESIEGERHLSTGGAFRALEAGFNTFLLCGAINDAWAAAHETLALAMQHHNLWMIKLAYDRLICLAFEFEAPAEASRWITRMDEITTRYAFSDSVYREVFLPTHWAQLYVLLNDGGKARDRAAALDLCMKNDVRLWRVRLIGVHLGAALLCDDDAVAHELAPLVEVDFYERRRWVDFPAVMYARYLQRFRGEAAARSFVERFVSQVRRELYPPAPELREYLHTPAPAGA